MKLHVPENDYVASKGWMQARVEGQLQVRSVSPTEACVTLVLDNGREVATTWPAGTAYVAERHALIDLTGRALASEGDRVSATGGFRSASNECGDSKPFAIGPVQALKK